VHGQFQRNAPNAEGEVRLVVSAYNDMWLNKESARELANWLFAYLHT
jgi:hypothetical protein